MQKLFKKYKIELSPKELKKFEFFLEIFKEKNSHINLSAIREDKEIIEKHFIDSIMLNVFLELKWNIADLGTGWWFPLIPLAIVNKNLQFTWIDSVWKKIKAIDSFIKDLKLKNVKTINSRAEDLWQNLKYRESFDFITSRAVSYFPTLLEYTLPLIKMWWIFVAYKLDNKNKINSKGKKYDLNQELKSAKKALTKLWWKILKIKNYNLAQQNRTIVLIEKIKKTHLRYPRRVGEPFNKPIK